MNKGIALLSAAAMLASGSALAGEATGGSDISWTYLQLGYVSADGNDAAETDGFNVMGSLGLAPNWHVGAGYTALDTDENEPFGNDSFGSDTWQLSVGWNGGLTKSSQVYADLGYFDTEYDDDFDGAEGDGIFLSAGVRARLIQALEVGAEIRHTRGEFEGFGDGIDYNDTGGSLWGQYFFVPNFSCGAAYTLNSGGVGESFFSSFSSGGDRLEAFCRYSFSRAVSESMKLSDSSDSY
jgi:hypothetical protein